MAGNQAPDIGQLTKILTIAIVATLILVATVGILFAVKIFTDTGSDSSYSTTDSTYEPTPGITPAYTEQIPGSSNNNEIQDASKQVIQMPVDESADDSVEYITSFTPDDPYFHPPEFNNTSPDNTIAGEYYQVIYENKQKLEYYSASMIVNVGKGPLIICYSVSNYIVTVGSGTGSTQNNEDPGFPAETIEGLPCENPFYTFLDITVIDNSTVTCNSTGEVVATGGFGRTYPSTEKQYLKIPMTGEFRIDIYGTGLDMDLKILSGTVPENPNAIWIDPAMKDKYFQVTSKESETEASQEIPEEMWW